MEKQMRARVIPDVSVIIPVYNAGALIDRCLDSVFNQAGNYNIEVLLIDDGSTDNSVDLIRRRPEQDRIRLLRQKNSGPSVARNRGLAEASGRYIAYIDADDYWLPEFLDRTIGFLDNHGECVAVSVAQRHVTLDGCSESPRNWNNITDGKSCVLSDFFKFWGKYNHICTGSILIRRKFALQVGGMREDLRSCEDLEFWAMIATKGQMGYIPEILFVSDGNKVTASLGWAKYKMRFAATKDFSDWSVRLRPMLTQVQLTDASPRFNAIVLGITRSFICGRRFGKAYDNMRYYVMTSKERHYMLDIAQKGRIVWYVFSCIYYSYRYLKVSLPYYRQRILNKPSK